MTNVTIFGRGTMGEAIAAVLERAGTTPQFIGSDGAETQVSGDIVVLAVPYASLAPIATAYADQLRGKVVVDISNPVDFSTFDALVVPAGSSATVELAERLPDSRVLKAFNTNFAATLVSGTVGSVTTTVLIAGDDGEAKSALAAVVEAGGLAALDVGSLTRAHELEAMGLLLLSLAVSEKVAWASGFVVAG